MEGAEEGENKCGKASTVGQFVETPQSGDEEVGPLPCSHSSPVEPMGLTEVLCASSNLQCYFAIASTSLVSITTCFSPDCPVHF